MNPAAMSTADRSIESRDGVAGRCVAPYFRSLRVGAASTMTGSGQQLPYPRVPSFSTLACRRRS